MAEGSDLVVQDIREDRHELFLGRGRVEASISAEPRVFQLGTPAALTVDMGCVYSVDVDDERRTVLHVSLGLVSVEAGERAVFVPEGSSCVAHPDLGPEVPLWDGTPAEVQAAVRRIQFAADPAPGELEFLVGLRDTLVLWHLLSAPSAAVRAAAYDNLDAEHSAPSTVSRATVLGPDGPERRLALEDWRVNLGVSWWIGSPW